jgi:hypothetical protein
VIRRPEHWTNKNKQVRVKVQKRLINRKIQNNTKEGGGGEVIGKCYSVVKIPCAGPGDKRNNNVE